MSSLNPILSATRSLTMGVENWNRHSQSPGWIKDQFVAIDHFRDPNASYEVVEAVIAEPVSYGPQSSEFILSMMLHTDSTQPMTYDNGIDRFTRPNQPGSLVFADLTKPFLAKGKGPFHLAVLYLKRDAMLSRIGEVIGKKIESLESLHQAAFFDSTIQRIFTRLVREHQQQSHTHSNRAKEGLVDALVGRLVSLAMPELARSNALLETISQTDRISSVGVRNVIAYMHAHFSRDLTRDELAKVAGVSHCHFSRLFKQTTGLSAKRFLMLLRLEKVSQLLRTGTAPDTILETARQCGFDSESHFRQEFRRRFGMTPSAYQDSV